MNMPKTVTHILDKLRSSGYEAYLVGGCVRDWLRGDTPKDYDLATDANPDVMKAIFFDEKLITLGEKHGTIAVITDTGSIEITTYRVDGLYRDNRRPEKVVFSHQLTEDLARRDFTINAMAYHPDSGLVDPFGGKADLQNGILRCVGKPERRFAEDALRILRALRFMAEHGFTPDAALHAALMQERERLLSLSKERVRMELERIVCGKNVCTVLLTYAEVLAVCIPEIEPCIGFQQNNPYHCYTVWEHICHSVAAIRPVLILRLVMLFHDMGKPPCYSENETGGHFAGHAKVSTAIAEKRMRELRFSEKIITEVCHLVLYHDCPLEREKIGERGLKRLLRRFGEEQFFYLCAVHIADDSAKRMHVQNRIPAYEQTMRTARELLAADVCVSLKGLKVNGHDLIACGYTGKTVGSILEWLLAAVMDGKVANEKKDLLHFLDHYDGI